MQQTEKAVLTPPFITESVCMHHTDEGGGDNIMQIVVVVT